MFAQRGTQFAVGRLLERVHRALGDAQRGGNFVVVLAHEAEPDDALHLWRESGNGLAHGEERLLADDFVLNLVIVRVVGLVVVAVDVGIVFQHVEASVSRGGVEEALQAVEFVEVGPPFPAGEQHLLCDVLAGFGVSDVALCIEAEYGIIVVKQSLERAHAAISYVCDYRLHVCKITETYQGGKGQGVNKRPSVPRGVAVNAVCSAVERPSVRAEPPLRVQSVTMSAKSGRCSST